MTKNCALINPDNPCHCELHVAVLRDTRRFDEKNIIFAKHPCRIKNKGNTLNHIREMDELRQIAALYKRHPDFSAPAVFIENLRGLVHSKEYELL